MSACVSICTENFRDNPDCFAGRTFLNGCQNFLTAADDLETEITGLQLGAMDYIRKPFVPDVLTGRVQRVLRTQERLHWLEKAAKEENGNYIIKHHAGTMSQYRMTAEAAGKLTGAVEQREPEDEILEFPPME